MPPLVGIFMLGPLRVNYATRKSPAGVPVDHFRAIA
jgi:hypothetical protein